MFFEIGVLKNFAILRGKHLCWRLFLEELLSGEYCEIFKKSYFNKTPPVPASEKFMNFPGNISGWGGGVTDLCF